MGGEAKNQAPFTRRIIRRLRRKPATVFAHDVSEQGLEFISRFEGCPLHPDGTLKVYNDAAGYATVGIGRLLHYSNYTAADVAAYHGKRFPDALQMLHQDAQRFVTAVHMVGVNLVQHEFDALVSFAFNCGPGALQGGIRSRLRAGDRPGAMVVLKQYDRAAGRVLDGLRRRRAAEADLFLHGVY